MKKVYDAGDKVARYLGANFQDIVLNQQGVVLTPEQVNNLILALIAQGFKNAITTLREAGDQANTEPERNLTAWAVYVSASSFLECQSGLDQLDSVCNCRCMQGRDCGGCGHKGCGFRPAPQRPKLAPVCMIPDCYCNGETHP